MAKVSQRFWSLVVLTTALLMLSAACGRNDLSLEGGIGLAGNPGGFGNTAGFGNPGGFGNTAGFGNPGGFGNIAGFGNSGGFGNSAGRVTVALATAAVLARSAVTASVAPARPWTAASLTVTRCATTARATFSTTRSCVRKTARPVATAIATTVRTNSMAARRSAFAATGSATRKQTRPSPTVRRTARPATSTATARSPSPPCFVEGLLLRQRPVLRWRKHLQLSGRLRSVQRQRPLRGRRDA